MNRQTASAPLQQQEHLGLIRLIGWTREGGRRREEARQNNGQGGHTLGGLAGGCIKCQKRRNNKNGTTEFGNGGRTEGGGGRFGTLGAPGGRSQFSLLYPLPQLLLHLWKGIRVSVTK